MENLITIAGLLLQIGASLNAVFQRAMEAHRTSDQATLDAILAKTEAAADALKPS